jgi:glutamate racemase
MEEFQKLFPDLSMVCFSDTQNCPYGDKDTSIIRDLTFRGVQKLFREEECDVVILACNTAAAVSIRWLQQEAMVDRHILSVTIPGVEAIENAPIGKISVLATTRTSQSHVYKDLIHAKFPEREVEEIACP